MTGLLIAAGVAATLTINAPQSAPPAQDHGAHQHEGHTGQQPREPIPPITEADREAAFPPGLEGHTVHDDRFMTYVLFDKIEWLGGGDDRQGALETTTWMGGDINRLWLRVDGAWEDDRVEHAQIDVLYGRSFSRWWDVVAGVRQDFRPGDPLTWAAVGIQGLAPYWFEVQATGYVGEGGRTALQLEAEHDLLITNRLILQTLVEATVHGKRDEARGVAAGLTSMETGFRVRYELRREFAPYVGVTWHRSFFGTADLARARGVDVSEGRLAIGVRTWW